MSAEPDYSNESVVKNLQEYLRVRSVHPNINYDECLDFLKRKALELELPVQVFEVVPKKPVLVMTWEGLQPDETSILLNSHMDVVPVFEESWIYPPFEAKLVDGVIYGRGAQDMKSIAIIYLETIRKLKNEGVRLKRTVHLTFVPEEEVGGRLGMGKFVESEHYKRLNVGFALDEGIPSATDEYLIYNGERSIWHINIVCPGKSGHGSLLLPDNCGEKELALCLFYARLNLENHHEHVTNFEVACKNGTIRYIIDKLMDLRRQSQDALANDPALTIGDVTSVNLTILSGGVQSNVIPEKMTATFDIRLALTVDHEEFENTIKQWCKEAGDGVTYNFTQKDTYVAPTKVDDSNPYWTALKATLDNLQIPFRMLTFPGGTDSRYVRACGVPALGLSPLRRVTPALHEHNESVPVRVLVHAVQHYTQILTAVANV